MTVGYCLIAERLLTRIEASHAAFVSYTGADPAIVDALRGLRAVFAAGLAELPEEAILATPSPEEWSMAEVLDHVAEHDTKYEEFHRLGIDHYVEHSLEHALQLWRLRPSGPRPTDLKSAR